MPRQAKIRSATLVLKKMKRHGWLFLSISACFSTLLSFHALHVTAFAGFCILLTALVAFINSDPVGRRVAVCPLNLVELFNGKVIDPVMICRIIKVNGCDQRLSDQLLLNCPKLCVVHRIPHSHGSVLHPSSAWHAVPRQYFLAIGCILRILESSLNKSRRCQSWE